MITASVESLTDGLDEIKPLLPGHWEELALNKDKVPLDPRWEAYLKHDAAGEILYVALRDAGRLVGYFVGFVQPALHYRTCLTLVMDVFWLHPEFRAEDSLTAVEREMACMTLFECVKKAAIMRGVKRPFFGSKAHKDASIVFEALGMVETERYYSAWWGE